MEINVYQKKAFETCLPTSENFSYMMLNLVGEVGEFASKVAKMVRKAEVYFTSDGDIDYEKCVTLDKMAQSEHDLMKEAGDIFWQLAGLCTVMGWSLEDIACMNLTKLAARQKAGTINGSGDGIDGEERKAE